MNDKFSKVAMLNINKYKHVLNINKPTDYNYNTDEIINMYKCTLE